MNMYIYSKSLQYESKPDYKSLMKYFETLLFEESKKSPLIFDWILIENDEDRKEEGCINYEKSLYKSFDTYSMKANTSRMINRN